MLSCIVLSDSHGRIKNVEKLKPLFEENGMVIHLGDGSSPICASLRVKIPKSASS